LARPAGRYHCAETIGETNRRSQMKLETLESIFRALAENGVRYLVVGGVAVNVHGYQRATQDLDLVVQLDRDNVLRALEALESLPGTTVDIFAAEPFPFEAEWTRAFQAELAPDLRVPCVASSGSLR
jgi:predicted nucleotidyltransferase